MSERLFWIDIAKGILIIFMVYGHFSYFAGEFANSDAFDFISLTYFLYLPYYMPAFFFITGFCSNFDISAREFLIKNLKTLIIPSILIGGVFSLWIRLFLEDGISYKNFLHVDYFKILLYGGSWFLPSLFLAKLFCFFLRFLKAHSAILVICSYGAMLIGSVLYNNSIPNMWYFQHALLCQPFCVFGCLFRKWDNIFTLKSVILLGGVVLLSLMFKYPFINSNPRVNWMNCHILIILAMAGTLSLLAFCKCLGRCKWLEYIGKHSLVIYLLHGSIMIFIIKQFLLIGCGEWGMIIRILSLMTILAITIFVSLLLGFLIEKFFPFALGRF